MTKKPAVKPELRQAWLKRYEEDGESPPQIAKNDGYDVRTVRKQLESAKQDREAREARSIVLRNALEEHYRDMCKYAEFLKNNIFSDGNISPISSPLVDIDSMNIALKQHLPRSPIWRDLNRLEQIKEKITQLEDIVQHRIEEEIEKDEKLQNILTTNEKQVIDGIIAVLKFQLKAWAQGQSGLNINDNFKSKPIDKDMVSVGYGFANMGDVQKQHVQDIKDGIIDFEKRIAGWEQLESMRKFFNNMKQVRLSLKEELNVIIYRRIVPGKCKYCPI